MPRFQVINEPADTRDDDLRYYTQQFVGILDRIAKQKVVKAETEINNKVLDGIASNIKLSTILEGVNIMKEQATLEAEKDRGFIGNILSGLNPDIPDYSSVNLMGLPAVKAAASGGGEYGTLPGYYQYLDEGQRGKAAQYQGGLANRPKSKDDVEDFMPEGLKDKPDDIFTSVMSKRKKTKVPGKKLDRWYSPKSYKIAKGQFVTEMKKQHDIGSIAAGSLFDEIWDEKGASGKGFGQEYAPRANQAVAKPTKKRAEVKEVSSAIADDSSAPTLEQVFQKLSDQEKEKVQKALANGYSPEEILAALGVR